MKFIPVMVAVGTAMVTFQSQAVDLNTDAQKTGYAIGVDLGNSLADITGDNLSESVDIDNIIAGLKDVQSGAEVSMSEDEVDETLAAFSDQVRAAMQEKRDAEATKNAEAGEAFLEENAEKEGIVTTPVGLQYKVIKQGNGIKPTIKDQISVTYEGRLIDGTVFDATDGKPATFPLANAITGWTAALQMMPEGSEYELYIPSDLGYGEAGKAPNVPPNSTLIFDVTLEKVVKADSDSDTSE